MSMRRDIRKRINLLLMNTFRSHMHSFYAAGVSSGLATGLTLSRLSSGRQGESIACGGPASDFIVVPNCIVVVLHCEWHILEKC
jgi:hypothetical protein